MNLEELRRKDVIQLSTGENLGRVDDISFNGATAAVLGLILHGRPRFFGLLGRDPDMVIPWEKVERIGMDVILTTAETGEDFSPRHPRRRGGGKTA